MVDYARNISSGNQDEVEYQSIVNRNIELYRALGVECSSDPVQNEGKIP